MLYNCIIQAAWATNKGVKESAYKDLWDVELGVTYIPWDQMPIELENLSEGGVVDDETLPSHITGSQHKSVLVTV